VSGKGQARVIGSFDKKKDSQVSIKKDEIVTIIDDSKNWWIVRNQAGEEGKAPNNYLKRLPQEAATTPQAADLAAQPKKFGPWEEVFTPEGEKYYVHESTEETIWDLPVEFQGGATTAAAPVEDAHVYYELKHKWDATKVSHLSAAGGEVLRFLEKTGKNQQWWMMENASGNKGKVPSNYLKPDPVPRPPWASPAVSAAAAGVDQAAAAAAAAEAERRAEAVRQAAVAEQAREAAAAEQARQAAAAEQTRQAAEAEQARQAAAVEEARQVAEAEQARQAAEAAEAERARQAAEAAAAAAPEGDSAAKLTNALAAMMGSVHADQAKEASGTGAASEWEQLIDDASGDTYYYNPTTQETRWDPPEAATSPDVAMDAAPGAVEVFWHVCIDPHSLDVYYFCDATGETEWNRPESTATERVVFKTEVARAKGNWTALKETQLSITKDEELDIIDHQDEHGQLRKWWTCRSKDGQIGKVPRNYLVNPPPEVVITIADIERMETQKPSTMEEAAPDIDAVLEGRDRLTLQLVRGAEGFGITFASPGGIHTIKTVTEWGQQAGVQVDDIIIQINNQPVTGMTHEHVVNELKCSPPRAIFLVARAAELEVL